MRKKRSGVWRYFEEAGQTKVSCRLCCMQLTKHGNTSMMLRHLRRRHSELMDSLFDTDGRTEAGVGISLRQAEEHSAEEAQAFLGSGKKKRSSVWRYFQQEETDKVRCRVCLEELATHYGNTTSMHRHLRGKHPQLKLGKLLEDSPKMMNHLHIRSGNTETQFLSICERLLQNSQLTDCTLVAEGQFVQLHRLVLATCSESFEEMFQTVTHANPVIILRDVTIQELRALISYMYKGKILVKSKDLPGLLKAASQLKIKGLSEVDVPESWLEDLCTSAGSRKQPVVTTTKASKTFYSEDQNMDDVTNNHSGQKKMNGTTMIPCKDIGPENVNGATVDDSIIMKRMQMKLEHGTGVNNSQVQTSYENPLPMDDHIHQQPEHQTNARFISVVEEEEEVLCEEPIVIPRQSSDETTTGSEAGLDNYDCKAQTMKDKYISRDSGEQNTCFSMTTSATAVQSGTTLSASTSDLSTLAAINPVRDGHLGFKEAAQAFNITQTTLFRASEKPDSFSPIRQLEEKTNKSRSQEKK